MAVTTEQTVTRDAPLSHAQRVAQGKAARAAAPRSSHAEFTRDPDRPDPLALLASQDATRVPELLPIRYGRMSESPFAYFRGAALPMAADLAGTPLTGLRVQACGDAHLMNFGLFASPERRLVFDINDFDETLPGPWEWDVKRLAASIEVAGRNNGFARKHCRRAVLGAVTQYRESMREFAGQTAMAVWYAHADIDAVQATATRTRGGRQLRAIVAKARTKDNIGALRRFTETRHGRLRIATVAPLIVQIDRLAGTAAAAAEVRAKIIALLRSYRATLEPDRRRLLDRYRLVDLAHKVVGVGSVGTRCWMLLLLGRDARDPLFLQAKQAGPSVLEEFVGRSEFGNAGQRVVVGQRLMQATSDVFLGWVRGRSDAGEPEDYYLRQLRDWKGSADVERMRPPDLPGYGRLCGWTLARAHARTGDSVAIAAYLGSGRAFAHAIAEFAHRYADQNERDYAALRKAIRDDRIVAAAG